MCRGGRLLADFVAGGCEKPSVPYRVEPSLTMTPDGVWVVWARKYARAAGGDLYTPLTAGTPYPRDALASCRAGHDHVAPQPDCSCGFHALSQAWGPLYPGTTALELEVALSGRVLAFEWTATGVLFRAERQTVVRVRPRDVRGRARPEEPGGRLARLAPDDPRSLRPQRLRPPTVAIEDDAGACAHLTLSTA